MNAIETYKSIPLQSIEIEDVTIGLRQTGAGDDLVLVHGFPTHGYTWRKLLPELAEKFRCHVLDLPGLGDSRWSENTDFSSRAQARYIVKVLEKLGIEKYSLIAHDSGATIARVIAIDEPDKVKNLILINTEIPGHRPPWIPFYQRVGLFPTVPFFVRQLFRQKWFISSPMGLRELYSDRSMLEEENNVGPYLNPAINSQKKAIGVFKYLKGIDWELVDDFKVLHGKIKANVLFLWGEDDKTFPVQLARGMTKQFNCKYEFVRVRDASLFPHEEKPEEVLAAIAKFVNKL